MIWRSFFFFAGVGVDHRGAGSRILVEMCAVAMAVGLVENKA